MKPHLTLAETTTPNGARLTLNEHDGTFCIRVNGQQLMHSSVSASELLLGQMGCERHSKKSDATRVLIGGLGLGFTLKGVLEKVGPRAAVHVAELFPEIVAWNRTYMKGLNGKLLDDPRVKVFEKDVRAILARSVREPYDVILLDIDNGTTAMVKTENNELYAARGLRQIASALKEGGRAAIWSAAQDQTIAQLLAKTGFQVQAIPAKLYPTAKRSAYMIYLADKVSDEKPAALPAPKKTRSR